MHTREDEILMICTPSGSRGCSATPAATCRHRPEDFQISPQLLNEAADSYRQTDLGPAR